MIPASIHKLIDKITIVRDDTELRGIFNNFRPGIPGRPVRIAFVNAHAFNLCWKNPDFLNNILECDYIFRDGAGMKILYRFLGRDAGLNLNGTDLIPRIMDLYKGHDVALMGTDTPYLESAARKITERGLFPVITKNGFHEADTYLEAVRTTPASLIILAMGMPKQEYIAAQLAKNIKLSCLIVCGGAILDFISERVARAPDIMRRTGLEWLYRLIQEPRRLFKRYIFGNVTFLWRAFCLSRSPAKDKEKLKILHVVRQYAPSIGGLESYVQNLVRQQVLLGHECEVLTLNKTFHGDNKILPAHEVIEGINIHRIAFFGKRRFFIPLVSPFFFGKYDVVHVHNTDVFYDYVGIACFITGVTAFATTHGGFFHTQDFSLIKKVYFQTITRFSSLFYKELFAISRNDEESFKKISGKVTYLPNAIQPLGNEIYTGEDFIYIGRLAKNKDIPRLIEVFAHLKNTHEVSGKLHIVGPEWDVTLDELKQAAAKHNILNEVVFHGACDFARMLEITRGCGYFASASSYEGFGMSMLEGMSVGLIPLVHSNAAFKQLVSESGVGLATDFNDPVAAARLISEYIPKVVMSDRSKAQAFTKAFSWPDLTEQTMRSYGKFV